jgi:hypothetical protein
MKEGLINDMNNPKVPLMPNEFWKAFTKKES